MSSLDLYNFILTTYGKRSRFLSELATELGISRKSAGLLAQACGYHNQKRTVYTHYNTFASSKVVSQVLPKIKR